MRFLLPNRKSSNMTKWHGIHLNLLCIIVLLLFSVINTFIFKFNIFEDISHDVFYLTYCGSVIETASDYVCYGSIFRLYPGKIQIFFEKKNNKKQHLTFYDLHLFCFISLRYCFLIKHGLCNLVKLVSLSIIV